MFHEVEAKSALNRVPGSSPVPFRWTVNPYRGCSHACVYCLDRRHPGAAGRRAHPADRRAAGRRRRAGHRAGRRAAAGTCPPRCSRTGPPPSRPTGCGWPAAPSWWPAASTASSPRAAGGTSPAAGAARAGGPGCGRATCCSGPGRRPAGPRRTHPAYRRGYLCGLVRGDEEPAAGRSFPSDRAGAGGAGSGPPLPGRARPSDAARGRARRARRPAARSEPPGPGRIGPPPARAGTHLDRRCGALAGAAGRRLVRRLPRPGWSTPRGARRAGSCGSGTTDDEMLGRAAGALHRLGFRFLVERPTERAAGRCGCSVAARSSCASCGWSIRPWSRGATWPARRSAAAPALAVESVRPVGRAAAVRHHHRHRRLRGRGRGQPQLLRPQHPHLPGPRRRAPTSTARSW